MANRESYRNSLERTNPHKRSFAELNTRRPGHAHYLPLHLNSNSSFPQAPSESLNRNFPPPLRLQRHEGDGYDFRRPVMSQQIPQTQRFDSPDNVIDLTSDSDSAHADTPDSMDLELEELQPRQQRRSRRTIPAHTPEVINLLEDDNDSDVVVQGVSGQSPEVQFVAVRPRFDRPQSPPRPTSPRYRRESHPSSWLRAGLGRYTGLGNRTGISGVHNYTNSLMGGERNNEQRDGGQMYRLFDDMAAAIQPILPRTDWFQGPGTMDFTSVGFDLATAQREPTRPATQNYEAPRPPAAGFTRTPKEDDTIVCPNCDVELGTSNDPVQKQIWVIRQCGHAYCGTCVNGRKAKKRILSKCVCDGCPSSIRSGKGCMFRLYI